MINNEIITILKSFINNEKLEDLKFTEDLYKLADSQKLLPLLYIVVKNNNISLPSELDKKLFSSYILALRLDAKQQKVINIIKNICDENSLRYFLFKGADIKNLYEPNREVRVMGDIDILLSKESRDIVLSKLFNQDFSKKDCNVLEIEYEGVSIEFHNEVNYFNNIVLTKNDIINNSVNCTKNLYMLIMHIIKHLRNSACGIRLFMDIALFIKKYNDSIQYDVLLDFLEKANKKSLGVFILYFIKNIFDVSIRLSFDTLENKYKKEDTIKDFLDYAMSNGVFGVEKIESFAENKVLKFSSSKFPKLRTLMYYAFPPKYVIYENYPKAKSRKIFLPIYYLFNICNRLFKQRKKAKVYFLATKNADYNKNKKNIYDLLEINE